MNQKTTALIIIVIAAIMLIAINCSGSSPSDTPPIPEPEICECTDKEHLGIGETCCETDDCTCTLKEYGKIGGTVPVYRAGITNAQMEGVFPTVQLAYNGLGDAHKIKLAK